MTIVLPNRFVRTAIPADETGPITVDGLTLRASVENDRALLEQGYESVVLTFGQMRALCAAFHAIDAEGQEKAA